MKEANMANPDAYERGTSPKQIRLLNNGKLMREIIKRHTLLQEGKLEVTGKGWVVKSDGEKARVYDLKEFLEAPTMEETA